MAAITRGGSHSTATQLRGISSCESSFVGVHLAQGVTFWVPAHAPKHLVTRFESVSTFLSYPAPGYPGRHPPHESYLSQGPLWGDMATSRVRLLSTGASMTLKPPFSSLYCYPGLSGFEAFPWRHSLHGLSYPWVSRSNTVDALPW